MTDDEEDPFEKMQKMKEFADSLQERQENINAFNQNPTPQNYNALAGSNVDLMGKITGHESMADGYKAATSGDMVGTMQAFQNMTPEEQKAFASWYAVFTIVGVIITIITIIIMVSGGSNSSSYSSAIFLGLLGLLL